MENRVERCLNNNCTKTHCARMNCIDGKGKDFNPDNKFKCAGYEPRFAHSRGLKPKVVAERNEYGRIVRKFIIDR